MVRDRGEVLAPGVPLRPRGCQQHCGGRLCRYPSFRVAYIDDATGAGYKTPQSVLLRWDAEAGKPVEVYRISLPWQTEDGRGVIIGEGVRRDVACSSFLQADCCYLFTFTLQLAPFFLGTLLSEVERANVTQQSGRRCREGRRARGAALRLAALTRALSSPPHHPFVYKWVAQGRGGVDPSRFKFVAACTIAFARSRAY